MMDGESRNSTLDRLLVPPYFLAPVLHKLRVILEFRLEILESTSQDEHFMFRIMALRLQNITCFFVYLPSETLKIAWKDVNRRAYSCSFGTSV